jgi:hypothetical protein
MAVKAVLLVLTARQEKDALQIGVAVMVVHMVVARVVALILYQRPAAVQSVSFIPARHVHSHQRIQETCNA